MVEQTPQPLSPDHLIPYAIISGTPTHANVGSYKIRFQSMNYYSYPHYVPSDPSQAPYIIINIISTPPIINIPPQLFKFGQTVQMDLSKYIKAEVPITDLISDPKLQDYGLNISFDKATQKTMLTGRIRKPVPQYVDDPITAKIGTIEGHGNFTFGVLSAPIKASDIDHKDIAIGELFSMPLKNHYIVPFPEDPTTAIKDYDLSLTLPDGKEIEGATSVKRYLGLGVVMNQLQGIVLDGVPLGEYVIHINCHNAYGWLIDNDGYQAQIDFPFKVTPEEPGKNGRRIEP